MCKSFCLRQRRGDFDLSNRDQLWKLLVQITLRKARNTANRHLLAKRDVRRDANDGVAPAADCDEQTTLLNQLDMDDPTPAEAALLNEALELRFQALREPELRLIAQKKLEGYTNQEIAQELQCTVRTVERKLARIRTYWGEAED
jgi:RNA polymerase sigma factor (sigma-70 family)